MHKPSQNVNLYPVACLFTSLLPVLMAEWLSLFGGALAMGMEVLTKRLAEK